MRRNFRGVIKDEKFVKLKTHEQECFYRKLIMSHTFSYYDYKEINKRWKSITDCYSASIFLNNMLNTIHTIKEIEGGIKKC